jgi:general secretion pathway protein N
MNVKLSLSVVSITLLAVLDNAMIARAQAPAQAQASSPPTASASAQASPLAALPLDRFPVTRERPLFSPARRPAPPPPPSAMTVIPKLPPAPPSLTLLGVVMDSEEARAIVQIANEVRRLRMGEEVSGWKVTQIEARKLVLSLDSSHSATFTMFGRENSPLPKEPVKQREASPLPAPAPPRRDRRE